MTSVVVAVDLGTSAAKVALIDLEGRILASAQSAYPTLTPVVGGVHGVEQHPDDWWNAVCAGIRECRAAIEGEAGGSAAAGAASGGAAAIVALSLTGQMQDVVVMTRDPDVTGRDAVTGAEALRPAILYSDLRATAEFAGLAAALPDWNERTRNTQDASSVAAKLAWLTRHEPALFGEADAVVFGPAAFVAARAGGEVVCDVVTASTTGLLDVARGEWYHDAVRATGMPEHLMPRLVGAAGVGNAAESIVGSVSDAAAAELGVPAATPIVVALGDAGSATDGLVGTELGSGYLYLGTTGWFARVVDAPAATRADYLYSLALPGLGTAVGIGAVLSAGSAAAWARDTFMGGRDFAEIDRLAAERLAAGPPADLLCIPALAGERAPIRSADARGTFVGATHETEAIDFYLAVLTGVALTLRHVADDLGGPGETIPVVGGAARSPVWRAILADVFNRPIVHVLGDEPGTLSAARHAIAALGLAEVPPPLAHTDDTEVVSPSQHARRYERLRGIHRDLYSALAPSFAALASGTVHGTVHGAAHGTERTSHEEQTSTTQ